MNSNSIPNLAHYYDVDSNLESPTSIVNGSSKTFPLYIAINQYEKRMEDELNMQLGDKIQVITDDSEYNDGWYYGKNLRTQEEGLYPVVFTQTFVPDRVQLTQEKSARRISTIMTNLPVNSTSELPTPQKAETATLINGSNKMKDRSLSLKKTMSDIDKALEELQSGNSGPAPNVTRKISDISTNMEELTIEKSWTPDLQDRNIGDYSHDLDNNQSRSASNNTIIVNKLSDVNNKVNTSGNVDRIPERPELNPKNVLNWTPEDVTDHFTLSGFDPEVSSKFKIQKISGKILLELELSHLKEIDIDSFGTRFEVFKEIEALKKIVQNTPNSNEFHNDSSINVNNRSSTLMPAAHLNEQETVSNQKNIANMINNENLSPLRDSKYLAPHSQTLNENTNPTNLSLKTDHQNRKSTKSNTPSLILTPDTNKVETNNVIMDENMFTSPRKAPKPPTYPSPVQPLSASASKRMSLSPMLNSPSTHYRSTSIEKSSSVVATPKPSSKSNKFKFPQSSGTIPNSNNQLTNNTSSASRKSNIYSNHRKSISGGSFVDLYHRVSSISSPYNESRKGSDNASTKNNEHQRQPSNISNSHSKNASQSNIDVRSHRRNSSLLSFFSGKNEDRPSSPLKSSNPKTSGKSTHSRTSSYVKSPFTSENADENIRATPKDLFASPSIAVSSDITMQSPIQDSKRRVNSTFDNRSPTFDDSARTLIEEDEKKRSISEMAKGKAMHKMAGKPNSKRNTTAFVEGIRTIKANDAIKDADCSGWMKKKGSGTMGVWKTRFFTLHGTRLSYFSSTTDTREKGLIDITGHRVVPAKDDDKIVSLYAASTGKGRYCFKLLPPQPGAKKGLTFTQPRVHYFAVDTKDEMRSWMSALIKSTIDINTETSVVSSYSSSTISLAKAKEMLSQARQENIQRQQGTLLNEEDEDQMLWEQELSGKPKNKEKIRRNRYTMDFSVSRSKMEQIHLIHLHHLSMLSVTNQQP
ncbi:hypothetical protein TPHA_0E00730 [Tetrapisispora phaffii CBS 4417]|uniref:PH domain-containing protein n=1 Tax=Tetrapisispora phaffii (strain ATCC 24235 / CBS 4417 / NBRC 1672 / NRRL Y-8282 / UCD 70-5) TaxID=1071381 RepID=G8BTE0_TETPH|nr:hypothetical protein TPHA_0E00730 [Tetrapisispora phaffii CBS 4417]CCE63168.1 hypothetical protein TPHA_0E00730 [Tetrapisispora phaffii CBS 4417]